MSEDYTDEQLGHALFQLGYENVTKEQNPTISAAMLEEAREYLRLERRGAA